MPCRAGGDESVIVQEVVVLERGVSVVVVEESLGFVVYC